MKNIRGHDFQNNKWACQKLVGSLVVAEGLMFFFITSERHSTITTSHIEKKYYEKYVFFGKMMVCDGAGVSTYGTNAVA